MDFGSYGQLFKALASETRLELIESLQGEAKTVNELVEETGRRQNKVSYHLKCLKSCGFVRAEAEGNQRIYKLVTDTQDRLFEAVDMHIQKHEEGINTCEILEEN
ncbi:MAG: metalloregulator ArsR/SmtB family transcription factor [Candidatus Nanohaloarchaea archaeon]|nr:metalloregulator ArsR/SmtB family transcription factor [Candidatus Nanohaloarchaea archaeon]